MKRHIPIALAWSVGFLVAVVLVATSEIIDL